jgi:hypothetical protein
LKLTRTKMIVRLHVVEAGTNERRIMTAQVMVPDEWRHEMPSLQCVGVDYLQPEPLAEGGRWGRSGEP